MLIKPYGTDKWWTTVKRIHPDKLIQLYDHSKGEFSPEASIAFDRHLARINQKGFSNQYKTSEV